MPIGLFLVQNKEDKLLHKISIRGVLVVQTLTFGINFSYFRQNHKSLHRCVVAHTRTVVLYTPHRLELHISRKRIIIVTIRCIISN